MAKTEVVHPFGDDEVYLWAEDGGPIMLKAVSGTDPTELNEHEAVELARILLNLASQIAG